MEHYHDFPRDSSIIDGVSIAESLLYKDAEEIRSQNFSSNNSLPFSNPRSSLGSTPLAPVNAVAAAAFGSAYSRTASGGLEEVCLTNDCRRPIDDNSVMNMHEQELTSIPLTSYCPGNNVSGSCDSSYSKWNELVNKIVDSQEDIPSLLLESVKDRNRSAVDCRDLTSAANVLFMRVNQLGDYVANKTTNGRSPSSSSNGSSSVTAIGETVTVDHSLVNKSCFDSSTKMPSAAGGEYGGYSQTSFSIVNTANNWLGTEEAGVYSSVPHLTDASISAANPSGLYRNDLKWANNYCVDNGSTEVETNTLHRVNTEPILSTIPSELGTKSSGSRLRPIIGKCSDDNLASIGSASPSTPSANVGGIQSLNLFNNQGGGSHLLPLLRKSAPQLMESNLNDRKPEATAVSSLMASTVASHAFNGGQNTATGVINGNLSSVTTPPFHLTADSLRLASRSQLNPNAEKFVFVPSSSNNGNNAVIHQQQHHPLMNQHLQQHHYHHTHAQHQQHQQSQQYCVSAAPYFQTKHSSVNSSISQGSLSGSSTAGNISLYTNSGNLSSISPIGTNATGATSTNTVSSLPSTLSHHLLSLGTISPVTYNFQSKFNILVEQRKSLDRERNRIEAELCRQYPGKRITTGVCGANVPPTVKSCNSSDRVDRELNTVLGNHARVVTLISKMEKLQNGGEPLPSHVHSTMECWLEGIRKCQARRKEELVNMTNRQRSGPRQQDEKDVVALTLALAELTEHMRRARTALWAALQMTHKDRASSATDAFRFLDHVRRHGLMVLVPPFNVMTNTSTMPSLTTGSANSGAAFSNEGILSAAFNSAVSTTRSLMNL